MSAAALTLRFFRRELRDRFAGAFTGGLWALLQPLLQLAIYAFVFVQVLKQKIPGADANFVRAHAELDANRRWALHRSRCGHAEAPSAPAKCSARSRAWITRSATGRSRGTRTRVTGVTSPLSMRPAMVRTFSTEPGS